MLQSDHGDVRVLYGIPVVDSFVMDNGRRIYTLCAGDLNDRIQRMGLLVRVQVNSIAINVDGAQASCVTFCSGGGA